MIKALKTITIGIITLLVLVSIFAVFTYTASAGWKDKIADLYRCSSEAVITYDQEIADDPFLPVDRKKVIPVTVSMRVVGEYAETVLGEKEWEGVRMFVHLTVVDKPEWCTANIVPYIIEINPTLEWKQNSANLTIIVDEDAPAFSRGNIRVESWLENFRIITGGKFYQDVRFKPGYLPILKLNVPEDTYSFTNPEDEARFDIEIENLGNAKTLVSSRVFDIPEGWTAYIEPSTVIGSGLLGDPPKKTIQLVVKPSNDFGYHDEREIIQVSMIPSYYGNSSLEGEEYILSFIVQSRGFTTPGFELVFVIFALIGISLIVKKCHKEKKFKGQSKGG